MALMTRILRNSSDVEQIKAEETDYRNYPIPKFYHFDSEDSKERILYANFERIDQEVKNMINPNRSLETVSSFF